jgi:hypothetical protein
VARLGEFDVTLSPQGWFDVTYANPENGFFDKDAVGTSTLYFMPAGIAGSEQIGACSFGILTSPVGGETPEKFVGSITTSAVLSGVNTGDASAGSLGWRLSPIGISTPEAFVSGVASDASPSGVTMLDTGSGSISTYFYPVGIGVPEAFVETFAALVQLAGIHAQESGMVAVQFSAGPSGIGAVEQAGPFTAMGFAYLAGVDNEQSWGGQLTLVMPVSSAGKTQQLWIGLRFGF